MMEPDSPLARMSPRSQASGTGMSPGRGATRSLFGASYSSRMSVGSQMSSKSSRARLFAQRDKSKLAEDVVDSERESLWDTSLHLIQRQQPWNSAAYGTQVPWHTHTSYDLLNWNLEPHPSWIAKAPGTFASTFERNLPYDPPLGPPPLHRPFTADWDPRFLVANTLSNDPVVNGHRKGLVNRRGTPVGNLSPSRPWTER